MVTKLHDSRCKKKIYIEKSLLDIIFSLLTLVVLEAILGIDNLVFISILSGRLPAHLQKKARRIGLMLAWVVRLLLLGGVFWIIGLTKPVFSFFKLSISWHDIFLITGGLFLLAKERMKFISKWNWPAKFISEPGLQIFSE